MRCYFVVSPKNKGGAVNNLEVAASWLSFSLHRSSLVISLLQCGSSWLKSVLR